MQTQNVNLYGVHADLSRYFANILSIHGTLLSKVEQEVTSGSMGIEEYLKIRASVELPPALLTSVASFLKQNDIMVVPDILEAEVRDYEDKLIEATKGIDFKDMSLEED